MNKHFLHLSIFLSGVITLTSCSREFQFVNVGHNKHGDFHIAKAKEKKIEHSFREHAIEEPLIVGSSNERQKTTNENYSETFCPNNEMLQSVSPLTSSKKNEPTKIFARSINKENVTPVYNGKNNQSVTEIKKPQPQKIKSRSHAEGDALLCAIIAIFIPPLGVALFEGITTNFWIDLLLTLLFYVPGLIFALIVILG